MEVYRVDSYSTVDYYRYIDCNISIFLNIVKQVLNKTNLLIFNIWHCL